MPIFGQTVSRKWATSPTCGNDGSHVNITNESFYHRFRLPEERKNRPLTPSNGAAVTAGSPRPMSRS